MSLARGRGRWPSCSAGARIRSRLGPDLSKQVMHTNVNGQGRRWPRSSTGARIRSSLDLFKQMSMAREAGGLDLGQVLELDLAWICPSKCQWPGRKQVA